MVLGHNIHTVHDMLSKTPCDVHEVLSIRIQS